MQAQARKIVVLGLLLLSAVLSVGCGQRTKPPSAAEFFPLVEGSEYTYRGAFDGKEVTMTIVVRNHLISGDAKVFYFLDKPDIEKQICMIDSNMFGLGCYSFQDGDLCTIEATWLKDLQAISASQKQLLVGRGLAPGSSHTLACSGSDPFKTVSVEGFEDVQVPAGKFEGCCKIRINEKWNSGTEHVASVWLARDVGLVKWIRTTGRIDELTEYRINKE